MSLRPHPARNSSSLLHQHRTLDQLCRAAGRLARLQGILEQYLQPAARPWCRVAALEGGVLTLIVSNSQWATHLRYQQNRLLRQLRDSGEFGNLAKIMLKVQPTIGERPEPRPAPTLSEGTASTLREAASRVASPALRAALERLARHTATDQDKG